MDRCFARRDDETETTKDRYSRAVEAWVLERRGRVLDAADVAQMSLDGTS